MDKGKAFRNCSDLKKGNRRQPRQETELDK